MKVQSNFLDNILPSFGQERKAQPIYNSGQRMFISPTYTSASGNMYYKGLRFSEKLIMVEKVGLYHNWQYIDAIELYSFNGQKAELISSFKFEKEFYDTQKIRTQAKDLLFDYLHSQALLAGNKNMGKELEAMTEKLIGQLYKDQVERFLEMKEGVAKLLNA